MRGAQRLLAVALCCALGGCRKGDELPVPPPPPPSRDADGGANPEGPCLKWEAAAVRVGDVPEPLSELSGLAASARHPAIFWAHNDSGHALELFAIRETGEVAARFPLQGATAPDVEDVAVGPCRSDAARRCVWLADIGDNLKRRAFVQLLEVEEPASLEGDAQPLTVTAYRFTYPGGPRDAEALVIDRSTGLPHVISKVWEHLGDVYRLEGLTEDAEVEAVQLGAFQAPREGGRYTTGADLSPDGSRLLLRTYGEVWEVRGGAGDAVQALLGAPVIEITSAPQPQSEAVAYLPQVRGYLIGTEGVGEGLFRVGCRD